MKASVAFGTRRLSPRRIAAIDVHDADENPWVTAIRLSESRVAMSLMQLERAVFTVDSREKGFMSFSLLLPESVARDLVTGVEWFQR